MDSNANELRVSLVQTKLYWEDIPRNIDMFDEKLSDLNGKADLVVLPEMFTTGFSMNASRLAEPMDGNTFQWLKEKAFEINAVITGSLIIEEFGKYYNRLIWMRPDGSFQKYDKRHLFSLAKEDETFTAGNEKLIIEVNGWKICPLICYDLRFPVWARNTENYDALIYTANFPAKRSFAWKQLLIARAIENQCFVLGVNIVGKDGNGFEYSGDSTVINPWGKTLIEVSKKEEILQHTITKKDLNKIRKSLPFLNDRDEFEIKKVSK